MAAPKSDNPFSGAEIATWHGFLVTHAKLTKRLDLLMQRDYRLSLAEFDVLIQLSLAGGCLRMTALAEAALISRSGMTRLVDQLVGQGLVAREPDPADARGTLAVLTPAGRRRFAEAAAGHRENVRSHFLNLLTEDERLALSAAWKKAAARLEAETDEPRSARRRSPASANRRRRSRMA